MKRKLKTLTEQFTDARTNYNRILGRGDKSLMTEQASVYTKCKYNKCSGGGFGWQYMKINGQTPEAGNTFMIGNTAFFTYVCWPNDTSNSGADYDCASNSGNYPNGFQQGDCPACESMNGGGTTGGGSQYPPYTCNYGCPGNTPCTTYGCTDQSATNYNSTILPNCGDNSCVWLGCTDSTASNYDPTATVDDGTCITTSSCDTSTSSPCAVQWFQNPNANWASTWITNRDCSNYNWPSVNLEQQANTIMAGAPNQPTIPYTYNSWNDIWSAGQNSGLSPANAFIAKMAKAKYSQCQIQACNC
jgi:hypothetical protein